MKGMHKWHLVTGTGWASRAWCASGRMRQTQFFGVPLERRQDVTCTRCLKKLAEYDKRKAER